MTQVANRQGQLRNVTVTTAAGVTTLKADDATTGERVTTFLMGESQAASLRADLPAGPATPGTVRQNVAAYNNSGDRTVSVEKDDCDETVIVARDGNGRVKVRLRMTPQAAADLASLLA